MIVEARLLGNLNLEKKVFGVGLVCLRREADAVFQERALEGEVVRVGFFPGEFRLVEAALVEGNRLCAVEDVASGTGRKGRQGVVGADGIVAGAAR